MDFRLFSWDTGRTPAQSAPLQTATREPAVIGNTARSDRCFQSDIHRLRGIAILLIVATHCATFFTWNQHPLALALVQDLFDNSTLIFMFISGYLFHHNSRDFQYSRYLRTKLRNVIAPYVIAAAPGIAYVLLFDVAKVHELGLDRHPGVERVAYFLVMAEPTSTMRCGSFPSSACITWLRRSCFGCSRGRSAACRCSCSFRCRC